MLFQELSLKDKIFIFKFIFMFQFNLIKLNDNEFRCYLTAIKMFIWISIIYLILNLINLYIGYYL